MTMVLDHVRMALVTVLWQLHPHPLRNALSEHLITRIVHCNGIQSESLLYNGHLRYTALFPFNSISLWPNDMILPSPSPPDSPQPEEDSEVAKITEKLLDAGTVTNSLDKPSTPQYLTLLRSDEGPFQSVERVRPPVPPRKSGSRRWVRSCDCHVTIVIVIIKQVS